MIMQVESDVSTESTTIKNETKVAEDLLAEKQVITGKAAAQILLEEDSLSPTDFHNNDNKILTLLNEAGSN